MEKQLKFDFDNPFTEWKWIDESYCFAICFRNKIPVISLKDKRAVVEAVATISSDGKRLRVYTDGNAEHSTYCFEDNANLEEAKKMFNKIIKDIKFINYIPKKVK